MVWKLWRRKTLCGTQFTEPDVTFLIEIMRGTVRDVVREELESLTAAAVDTLKPCVDTIAENEKSLRLILDGQVIVEKAIVEMTSALGKARGLDEGDWWKTEGGNAS